MEKQALFTRNFVLCSVLCFFFTIFFFMFYTGMTSYSQDVLGTNSTVAGLTASIFVLGDVMSRMYFGRRQNRIGKKRLTVGFLVIGTLVSLFYFEADSVAEICIVRLVHGFTYGAMATAVNTIVAESLPASRRGEGMGYFMLSLSVGSALGPFVCMYLQDHGTYDDIFGIGVLASFCALVVSLFLKDGGPARGPEEVRARTCIFERSAVRISLVAFVFFFSYSGVLSFISPYGKEIGLYDYAIYFFVTLSVGTLICRLFLGKIYDVYGENTALIPMFILYLVGMAILSTTGNGYMLLLSGMLIGFNIAMLNSVGQSIVVREAEPATYGSAIATFSIMMDLAYAVGPILNGTSIDLLGYRGNYMLMAGIGLLSLVMYLVLHGMQHRGKPRF